MIQKGASLADLYDPITMPPDLVKAHNELDKAVDLAYRSQPFANEAKRMEFLFELYEKYTAGLFTNEKGKRSENQVATIILNGKIDLEITAKYSSINRATSQLLSLDGAKARMEKTKIDLDLTQDTNADND